MMNLLFSDKIYFLSYYKLLINNKIMFKNVPRIVPQSVATAAHGPTLKFNVRSVRLHC